jgi:integrase
MPRANTTGVRGLYKRDGRYEFDLRWREPSTGEMRRHQERFADGITAAAAKTRARELVAACLAGGFDPKRAAPLRLSEAFKEYMKWCEANRPGRKKKRQASCDRLLAVIGDKRLNEVVAFDVERFKRARLKGEGVPEPKDGRKRKETVAPTTVNRDLEVLSHFFGLAAAWGLVSKEAADAVRAVDRLKEPPGRVRHLSADEEARLFGALPVQVLRIVVIAVLTGMRQDEVVQLKKSAVDLDAAQITLTKTKSNKVRPVYLNEHALNVIKDAMAASPGDHVFATRKGKPYTNDGVRSIFYRARTRADVKDFRFHDLRHTTATRLRRAGAGLDIIADVLGHATLTMARRYAHLGKETMRAAMVALPSPIAPVAPAPKKAKPKRGEAAPKAAAAS